MKIEDIRSEFRVILVDENYRRSNELSDALKEVGYQTQFYPTTDSALVAVRASSPHVFILHYSTNESNSEKTLAQVRKISPETQLILMINETHLISSIMKNSIGEIFDYLVVPFIAAAELIIRIDRAAQRLYLQFENEQLRKRRGVESVVETALEGLTFEEDDSQERMRKLQTQIEELTSINDQDELIKKYIFNVSSFCGSMPVVYLRFLTAQLSFVYGQSIWSPVRQVDDLGFRIQSLDTTSLMQMGGNPTDFEPLQKFMYNVFEVDEFSCLLHFNKSQLTGIAVVLNKSLREEHTAVRLSHKFFESIFERNELVKELHTQQRLDALTGLLNKKAFDEKLQEEVSRARRIQHPLSVLKLHIDNFDLLGQKYGEENMLLVVKALAKSMKKNFRNSDILSRLTQNEFCFLLPHTEVKNTLLKAEKVRRAFAQSQFPFVKIEDKNKFSLSIGVSEYPSLSSDAESLMKSCDEALYQVKRNQGNRVAAWQAGATFSPDFLSQPMRSIESEG